MPAFPAPPPPPPPQATKKKNIPGSVGDRRSVHLRTGLVPDHDEACLAGRLGSSRSWAVAGVLRPVSIRGDEVW